MAVAATLALSAPWPRASECHERGVPPVKVHGGRRHYGPRHAAGRPSGHTVDRQDVAVDRASFAGDAGRLSSIWAAYCFT